LASQNQFWYAETSLPVNIKRHKLCVNHLLYPALLIPSPSLLIEYQQTNSHLKQNWLTSLTWTHTNHSSTSSSSHCQEKCIKITIARSVITDQEVVHMDPQDHHPPPPPSRMEKDIPIILDLLAVIIIMIIRTMPTIITTHVVAITTNLYHILANVKRRNSHSQRNPNS